ncbi:hypothetical protein K2173_010597 [Erythroxylum novogranatense]|uniref:WPP domain-interacting protein 1 n=1 Tax=Erythroxylum novogranatense TaxID=1862640 RepID=A0AAV8TE75_9ROSI|nr:hypothetical protein K2173_010597 [Erythroxylum novogranatense]
MDLGSECSAHESVEDNELATPPEYSVSNLDEEDDDVDGEEGSNNKIKANNGPCSIEIHGAGNASINTSKQGKHFKGGLESEHVGNSGNLSPLTAKSPATGSPPATKGYGLKKWRRIKRGVVKDVPVSVDNSKNLKRPSSANPAKPTDLTSFEIKQNSEGSVRSVNVLKNVAFPDGFLNFGSSFDSRFAVGSAFMAGTDSDNSEDRCSKSSTATSAPRGRYELPAALGYLREKSRVKSLSGKGTASSSQRAQQVKVRVEGSKKPRGERVKFEKENSHSSLESDSRSSNFVLMQGASSVTSNGKQAGMPTNSDGENSDEAHADDRQFTEEVQAGYQEENAGKVEDLSHDDLAAGSSWEGKEDKDNMTNNQPSTNQDPLTDSILALQSVQEALGTEIQKLGEIGKINTASADFVSACEGIDESDLSDQLESQSTRKLTSLESEVLYLRQSVMHLESRLEEARTKLKRNESGVGPEAMLNHGVSLDVESGNTVELGQMNCKELEMEIDDLLMQKIQGEVEYLALACTLEKLRIDASNHIRLQKEQLQMVESEHAKEQSLLQEESKEIFLRKQAEELEKYKGDVLGTEEVLKMQKGVCKVTSCFFVQLILFVLVFELLVLQLSSRSSGVVPT